MSKANDQVIGQDWRVTSKVTYRGGRVEWRRELRGAVTRGQAMSYRVKVDHLEYVGTRDGRPFTLPTALEAIRGVANAHVLRPDGSVVR